MFERLKDKWRNDEEFSGYTWGVLGSLFGMVIGLYALYKGRPEDLATDTAKTGVCLFVLYFAIALTKLKKSRLQVLYGSIETIAGLVSCWYTLGGYAKTGISHSNAVAFLIASTYLVKRGVENFEEGHDKWVENRYRRAISANLPNST
jgi:hypothetical protein